MEHNLVQIGESGGMGTGCSRCGAVGAELNKPCTYVSDGEMYKRHPKLPPIAPAYDDKI